MSKRPVFGGLVLPFQIEALNVRGRLVRLGTALDDILTPHGYPPAVAEILAETVTLAAVLSSGLKFDGVFTLQTQSDGPVGLMVADITSDGAMRGYARFDEARLEEVRLERERLAEKYSVSPSSPSRGAVPSLLGAGHLAFTVDQGPDTERYQGVTELTGATMADCAHTYFRQSEQLDTAIMLASDTGGAGAGALLLQRLPQGSGQNADQSADQGADMAETSEDDWRHAVVMMGSLTVGELLDPSLSPPEVLFRLFHEDGVRVYREKTLRAQCRCSREKVIRTLKSFPKEEVQSLRVDGKITVTCEFCKNAHIFEGTDLEALYLEGTAGSVAQ